MDKLSKIERQRQIVLPECYKIFYRNCSLLIPRSLIGTDLINNKPDLQEEALSLLQEDGAENFLSHNDFVFMMHQGYMFGILKQMAILTPLCMDIMKAG